MDGNHTSDDEKRNRALQHPLASAIGQGGSAKTGAVIILGSLAAFIAIGSFFHKETKDEPTISENISAASYSPSKITDLRQSLINGERVEVVQVDATRLFREYERNEVATDIRLKGKIVEIFGIVTGINKDFWDSVYVNLKTSNEFMSASIRPLESETEKMAQLRKGQHVKFRCEKMQRFVGSPSGSNCVLMD